MSITKPVGSSTTITCEVLDQSVDYIHWYKYQEGEAPQRLFYYKFSSSQIVVDSNTKTGKYHAYKGPDRSCIIVLRNLEESDSAVYYCAAWTYTAQTQ